MKINLTKTAALLALSAIFCTFTACSSATFTKVSSGVLSTVTLSSGMEKTAAVIEAGTKSASLAMEDITPEDEYYIGRAVGATILTNYKAYQNPQLESYLNKICLAITSNSEAPEIYNGYHVKVLDTSEINAFATSGGHIFVTRGLIRCAESEDALAAVLAHEIAHIQLKHSLGAIKASRWVGVATAVSSAAAKNNETAKQLNSIASDVVTALVNNGYSHANEFDADSKALMLLADTGYSPYAMKNLLNKMKEVQGSAQTGFGKTHPSPDMRIANVNKVLLIMRNVPDTTQVRKARFEAIVW